MRTLAIFKNTHAAGWLLAAPALLLLSGCVAGPGIGKRPVTVTTASARAAAVYSARHAEVALIIDQNGRSIHRSGSDAPYNVRSITKNFWAILTLQAVADGLLTLDEPASQTLSEWQRDPAKRRITIRQLLSQTGGLAPGGSAIYGSRSRDKFAAALDQPVLTTPGSTFRYGPAHMEALGEILRRKLAARNQSLPDYMQQRLLNPLGISSASWNMDRAGNPSLSAGLRISPTDLAKFGRFIENNGTRYMIPLVPGNLVREALEGTAANPSYGLTFWTNQNSTAAGVRQLNFEAALENGSQHVDWRRVTISHKAPAEMIVMIGSRNQRVYILPREGLTIVRLGRGTSFNDAEFLDRLLVYR